MCSLFPWQHGISYLFRSIISKLKFMEELFQMISKNYHSQHNVRHGHMSTNTTVTFRNFNDFTIRFLILLEDQISEILSGFDNNWSHT
jgi:hypothetical protein